jgi:hypothetical protein
MATLKTREAKVNSGTIAVAVAAALISSAATGQSGVYEGRIAGEFKGWTGDTIYKLADGRIIQQASYYYHYH